MRMAMWLPRCLPRWRHPRSVEGFERRIRNLQVAEPVPAWPCPSAPPVADGNNPESWVQDATVKINQLFTFALTHQSWPSIASGDNPGSGATEATTESDILVNVAAH